MTGQPSTSSAALAACLGLATLAGAAPSLAADVWNQWGGADRDFREPATELDTDWGEDGPRELWRRPLGPGHSAIVVEGDRLFTMTRRDGSEVVVAMARATGATLWEQSWEAPVWRGYFDRYGTGPQSTPLVADGRVYAIGIHGNLVCLDAATGEVQWRHDLWDNYEIRPQLHGFSQLGNTASPLLHGDLVIALAGGEGSAVAAVDRRTGERRWSAGSFRLAFASPLVIEVGDGDRAEDQLVVFSAEGVHGLSLDGSGRELWKVSHPTDYVVNASTPIWDAGGTLWVSSAYDSGSEAWRIASSGGETTATPLWKQREVEVHHQAAVLIGDVVYASSGDFGPAFLTGTRLSDGELLFKQRGFPKANLVAIGERLLILDEDGGLALAAVSDEGVEVLAQADVFESRSWTVPSVVGSTVYARDLEEIVAFDLSG